MLTDGRTPDAGVTGILIAHLGAFGSGELKIEKNTQKKLILKMNSADDETMATYLVDKKSR